MYSPETLKKHGITEEKLKSLSEGLSVGDRETPFAKWIDREAARIRDGVDRNLRNWRLWWALDQAYDAPFHQISYTLMKDILEKDYDESDVNSLVEDFGLTHMLVPKQNEDGSDCCGSDGKPIMQLNVPVFSRIFVPLCSAYLKARWSKLFNDRDQHPRYKYEPAYSTLDNRIRCDIWTNRISVMANQFGYANDDKDAIFNALHYGIAILFPREAWHREMKDGKDGDEVYREGLRFNIPPPERLYYDLSERLSGMNYNMGPSFAGYWHIAKLSDIQGGNYWNKNKISFGNNVDIISASPNFFANIYPCTLKFPVAQSSDEGNNRESEYSYYASGDGDQAVLVTEHFTRVIPKDVGLGNYDKPVNFRMVILNYDTPAYIEPIYCGFGAYYGYDSEGNRARNASLTLEVMPFQDHVGNILTHWLSSAKQNLTQPTFVDTAVVDEEAINSVKNQGHKLVDGRQFITFNSKENKAALIDHRTAFHSPNFPSLPTGEMQQLISGIIDILERALGFSAQEIGQAASHEQSATESKIIDANISNRVRLTGTFIDEGVWGKKKMIYEASVAQMDDDVMAEISPSYAPTFGEFKEIAKNVGISVVDRAGKSGDKALVRAPVSRLEVEAFASTRDAESRINNPAIASAAAQILTTISGNEVLFMSIGPEQVIELTNQICSLLDLPKDFRLKFSPPQGQGGMEPDMIAQIQQQMGQLAEQVAKRIEQGEAEAAKAIQSGDKQIADGLEDVAQQSAKRIEAVEKEVQSAASAMLQLKSAIDQIAISQVKSGPVVV